MGKRNTAIDIFRYLCATLVIAIHTNPFVDISPAVAELIRIIARIAVPFFFATSGYYITERLKKDPGYARSYLWKAVKLYFAWSCVYFVFDFINWGHASIIGFAWNCVIAFFVKGSHYHLWYMIALISSVCVAAVVLKLKKDKLLIALGIAIALARVLPLGPITAAAGSHYLSGLPYFAIGFLIRKLESVAGLPGKVWALITGVVFVVWVVVSQYGLVHESVADIALYVVIGMIMLTLIKNPTNRGPRISKICQSISDFMYFCHPIGIEVLLPAVLALVGIKSTETIMFIATVIFASLAGLLAYWVKSILKDRKKRAIMRG